MRLVASALLAVSSWVVVHVGDRLSVIFGLAAVVFWLCVLLTWGRVVD